VCGHAREFDERLFTPGCLGRRRELVAGSGFSVYKEVRPACMTSDVVGSDGGGDDDVGSGDGIQC
jgi:hypothetical protein